MNFRSLFRRKPLTQILKEGSDGHAETSMNKNLGLWDLVFMGVAAVIGAGIFSTMGDAAFKGGPAIVYLFIITAVTCGFTALCYAEFAARVPVSGSAYTYSYVSFGEVIAWIIGWALILEYAIGNIYVATSWAEYFDNLLRGLGINLPRWVSTDSATAERLYKAAIENGKAVTDMAWTTAPEVFGYKLIINLPAFVIVILITALAYVGIKESKRAANAMVYLKLFVLCIVIGVGFFHVNAANYTPFMPNGFNGVMASVSSIFFAYIGFDAISTTSEECKDPQRDMPKAMIYALLICTVLYILVTLIITGMVNYKSLQGVADPLAFIFDQNGMAKLGFFISACAVVAATSVLLVFQVGQPRIWMSMSRDGLLPKAFSHIHPKFQTPDFSTIVTGFLVAIPSLFLDRGLVVDLTSIGTLFAFALVSGGVLMLPKDESTTKRFRLPYINGMLIVPILSTLFIWIFRDRVWNAFINFSNQEHQEYLFLIFIVLATIMTVYTALKKWSAIPVLGVLFCSYLMIEIPVKSWFVFFGWMALGLSIYFAYGFKKSRLAKN
jgi:basic amino acid/polyamine antiporter, APA family